GGDHFGLPPDCAIIERRLAGKRAQQAGFARTVAPDEGDALAAIELETHVIEQIDVTEGEAGVIDGKQGHWRWVQHSAAVRNKAGDFSPPLAARAEYRIMQCTIFVRR